MSKQILIVDDDPLLRRSLAISLQQAGYATLVAGSAEEALSVVQHQRPDLILLDIGLPNQDGLQALMPLRTLAGNIPVIFVTARRRELDEVVALELGADDYITKPFDLDVLQAHIRAVLRRTTQKSATTNALPPAPVVVGDLSIDPARRMVLVGDTQIDLSPKEFDLLLLLAQQAERVLTMDDLLNGVWGVNWLGEQQTLYVHVRWLREKIETDPAHPTRLITIRGVGYKLMAPVASHAYS